MHVLSEDGEVRIGSCRLRRQAQNHRGDHRVELHVRQHPGFLELDGVEARMQGGPDDDEVLGEDVLRQGGSLVEENAENRGRRESSPAHHDGVSAFREPGLRVDVVDLGVLEEPERETERPDVLKGRPHQDWDIARDMGRHSDLQHFLVDRKGRDAHDGPHGNDDVGVLREPNAADGESGPSRLDVLEREEALQVGQILNPQEDHALAPVVSVQAHLEREERRQLGHRLAFHHPRGDEMPGNFGRGTRPAVRADGHAKLFKVGFAGQVLPDNVDDGPPDRCDILGMYLHDFGHGVEHELVAGF